MTYNGYAMTWNGRKLVKMSMNGGQFTYSFTYNDAGIRTSKNVNGSIHHYALDGSQIVSESWGNHFILYLYDESGAPIGLKYRTASYAAGVFDTYFFEKNIFGDIIGVYTENGVKIGSYTYDAWGNCTVNVESTNTSIQKSVVRNFNPFRYRGYFYDYETGLYYLQSRYYDPATGRFINADGLVSTGQGLLGYNMYAYCNNNPVMYVDPTGESIGGLILGLLLIGGIGALLTSCESASSSAKPAAPDSSSQSSYGSAPEYHSVKSVPCDSYADGLSIGFNYVYDNSRMYHWRRETAVAIWYCSSTDSYSVEYYEGIGGCTCSLIPIPSSPDYTVVATIHSHPTQELDAIYGHDWNVYANGYDKKIEMYVMDYNLSMKYLRITYLPRNVDGIDRAKIYWDGVLE